MFYDLPFRATSRSIKALDLAYLKTFGPKNTVFHRDHDWALLVLNVKELTYERRNAVQLNEFILNSDSCHHGECNY